MSTGLLNTVFCLFLLIFKIIKKCHIKEFSEDIRGVLVRHRGLRLNMPIIGELRQNNLAETSQNTMPATILNTNKVLVAVHSYLKKNRLNRKSSISTTRQLIQLKMCFCTRVLTCSFMYLDMYFSFPTSFFRREKSQIVFIDITSVVTEEILELPKGFQTRAPALHF